MSFNKAFTKDNLDRYLRELAREFRKRNGKEMPAEIILIGGASILANYGFREMTYDMDAIIQASSVMKDAINYVGDTLDLPTGWLNTDFMRTESYTPELITCSKYYKTFSNIVTVRTVTSEYLIAMKLMSGRKYKNDLSDVVGILQEHQKTGNPISMEQITSAVLRLYGDWDKIPKDSRQFIDAVMENGNYAALFQKFRDEEQASKEILLDFEKVYPNTAKEDNIDNILKSINAKKRELNNNSTSD